MSVRFLVEYGVVVGIVVGAVDSVLHSHCVHVNRVVWGAHVHVIIVGVLVVPVGLGPFVLEARSPIRDIFVGFRG